MLDSVIHREKNADAPKYVAPEVSYLLDRIVNVCFIGAPGETNRGWILVDCGLPGSASKIKRAASRLFGEESRPAAIVLTHGHFDHIGEAPRRLCAHRGDHGTWSTAAGRATPGRAAKPVEPFRPVGATGAWSLSRSSGHH